MVGRWVGTKENAREAKLEPDCGLPPGTTLCNAGCGRKISKHNKGDWKRSIRMQKECDVADMEHAIAGSCLSNN